MTLLAAADVLLSDGSVAVIRPLRPEDRPLPGVRVSCSSRPGSPEWLAPLDDLDWTGSTRPRVAVFDTKAEKARRWPGSAAWRIARIMTKQGFVVVDRTSFFVDDVKGPIGAGEQERPRLWGRHLVEILHDTEAASP